MSFSVTNPLRVDIHIAQRFNNGGTNHLPAFHPIAILAPAGVNPPAEIGLSIH